MDPATPPNGIGMSHRFGRAARRVVVTVVGLIVLALGVAMLALPGPGIITIVAGLAILASEYRWAKRLYVQARARSHAAVAGARNRVDARRGPRPSSTSSTVDLTRAEDTDVSRRDVS